MPVIFANIPGTQERQDERPEFDWKKPIGHAVQLSSYAAATLLPKRPVAQNWQASREFAAGDVE